LIWNRDRQTAAHNRYKRRALRSLGAWVIVNEDEILAMSDARHAEGFETYGETMYLWEYGELRKARMEEIADYVTYTASGMARGWWR